MIMTAINCQLHQAVDVYPGPRVAGSAAAAASYAAASTSVVIIFFKMT